MATITFTSTFSSELMDWLQDYAKQHGVTKRSVLEDALKCYRDIRKKQTLQKEFAAMAQDKEYMKEMEALAEAGIGDWSDSIKALES